jgi:hypothetical protein
VSLAVGASEYFAIRKDLLNRLVESEQRVINERSGSVRLSISYGLGLRAGS